MGTSPTQLTVTSWLSMSLSSPWARLLQLSSLVSLCSLAHGLQRASSQPRAWAGRGAECPLTLPGCEAGRASLKGVWTVRRYGWDSPPAKRIPCNLYQDHKIEHKRKSNQKKEKLYVPAILSGHKQGRAVSRSSVGVCVSHLFPIVVPCQLPDP